MFPSDTDFETSVTLENEAFPISEKDSFRILLLGDWSGRNNLSEQSDLKNLRPIEIDRDNFDEVLRKFKIKLGLDLYDDEKNLLFLDFSSLEDFHPDQIFQKVSLFSDLRDLRWRLSNENTFENAANEVRSWFSNTPDEPARQVNSQPVQTEVPQIDSSDLLDQILNKTEENNSPSDAPTVENSPLSGFIRKIINPVLIKVDEEEQSLLISAVDDVISQLMNAILHHPAFQSLESAWRGLYFLITRIETNSELKLFLLDVSKAEISEDLKSVENLTASKTFQLLITESLNTFDEPWSILYGNYNFSCNVEDAALLMRLGKIAKSADLFFISNVDSEFFGLNSFADAPDDFNWNISEKNAEQKLWEMIRSVPEASNIYLLLPRFLGRLPYGKTTDPIESFNFEEFSSDFQNKNYLWLQPGFLGVVILAWNYQLFNSNIKLFPINEIENLFVHIYSKKNETQFQSCLENSFSRSIYEKLINQGFIPFITDRNSDKIRLPFFQNISG